MTIVFMGMIFQVLNYRVRGVSLGNVSLLIVLFDF